MAKKSAYGHLPLINVYSVKTGALVWQVTSKPGMRLSDTVRALSKRPNGGWSKVPLKKQFTTVAGLFRFLANRAEQFEVKDARPDAAIEYCKMVNNPAPDPVVPASKKPKAPPAPMEDRELSEEEKKTIYVHVGRYHCLQPARITMARTLKRPMVPEMHARVLAEYESARAQQIANYRAIMGSDPLPDESLVRLVMARECEPSEIGL